jgi:hypothetical protein
MSDAFDELERRLRRAVRTSRRGRAPRGWRRTAAVAIAAALVVTGAALAATRIGGGRNADTDGSELALRVVGDTARLPACAHLGGPARAPVLTEAAPLPAIVAALPALGRPASAVEQQRAQSLLSPGATGVLRQTLRTVAMPGGLRLLVYVEQGMGFVGLRDPAACARARRARMAQLARGRSEAVRRHALRRLAELRDTLAGLQTLWLFAETRGSGERHGGGAGVPVSPGAPVRPGLLFGGGTRDHASIYAGIARRRTARLLVRPERRAAARRIRMKTVPVRDGLWALRLPRGTGPVRLVEVASDGVVLGTIDLRR